jgi:hypothetical protein
VIHTCVLKTACEESRTGGVKISVHHDMVGGNIDNNRLQSQDRSGECTLATAINSFLHTLIAQAGVDLHCASRGALHCGVMSGISCATKQLMYRRG